MNASTLSQRVVSTVKFVQESDFLYRLVLRRFPSSASLYGFIALLHLAVWGGVGAYVELREASSEFVGILSTQELTFGSFLFGLFVPIAWVLYSWLLRGTFTHIGELCATGVIRCNLERGSDYQPDLLDNLVYGLSNRLLAWSAVGATVVVLVLYYVILIPGSLASAGKPSFWFYSAWTRIVLGILVGVNAYVICLFALRSLSVSVVIWRQFSRESIVTLHLFHPDGCGGFAPIGRLATKIAYAAVLVGVWATWFVLLPVTVGGKPNALAAVVLYPSYLALSFSTLFSILYPVHRAMVRYKHSQLESLGYEIEARLLEGVEGPHTVLAAAGRREDEDLKRLREVYDLISSAPEWPISSSLFRRFSGIAFLPALSGFLSVILDIIRTLLRD